jgi:hypothetical protein
MAYIPKARRRPPEWIKRRELLTIVRAANPNKDDATCWCQVAHAVEDRELPARWADAKAGWPSSPIATAADEPPTCRDYWLNVEIDPSNPDAMWAPRPYDRKLVDSRTAARLNRARTFRTPLFSHAAALHLWPQVNIEPAFANGDLAPRPAAGITDPIPQPEIVASDGGETPKPSTPSGIRTTTAEKAEAACGAWIAALAERPKNKPTAFEQAKAEVAHIGPLSERAFERAWAARAPTWWKQAGRRKGC